MFHLTQFPQQWADAAGMTLLAGAGVAAVVAFARWLWAEARVARRWLRGRRRPVARAVVVGRLGAKAARLVAVAAFVTWYAPPAAIGVHTYRQLYVIDAARVAAVEVEVTDHGPRVAAAGPLPPPRRVGTVVLADPAEVEAVVARLAAAGPFEYPPRSPVGRTYVVRFRGRDGLLQPERVVVAPSSTIAAGTYETEYKRSGWPFGLGLAGPYANPELGRWLEAAVAARLPPDP